nr:MAG TPA: hypothetical protein [Bacteriophage sp.]
MEFNLLDKYNALNSFSKEKVNEFVNKELDKLFGKDRTRTYENQEDYTHVEKGILSISYNDLIQSTQGAYNQFAQQLQCGPQEFAGAIYMKLIHEVQELGFKTIAVGNFGSIILKGNGEPIVAVDETAPYDYQPDQNNHVYGIRTEDLNGEEIFIAFVDYRLANHIAEFTEADVHALDLNTLSYPYYCKEDKAQLRSPVTRMSIQGNLVGYIMPVKEVTAIGDFILGYIHDYDKEIITENQKVVCTYRDEDYEDFCVYDFKIEGFAQKATSPEAVEEILKDIREQISKEGVHFCHVEPVMMAVDDDVSYFRMLVWSTAPNRQRYLPPVVVEEMLVHSSWAGGTTFLPTIELAAHVGGEIDELINENELASDMMGHLESVRGFITLGYLACEINHFLKLTEKENWPDKTYVPYSVNGVTFSMNYLDAKNQRITVVNDMVYEGLVLKSSEGKPVSELGEEHITVINGSTVNRVLVLDEEERGEQIVDDALFSGPSSNVESGYYYGTHLVFKGKVTYQEVMEKHEKLLRGVTVEGESFKHSAMVNGNPMFLLTYVKASDLGENAKYWEAESEGAYYINNPMSSIYNMSTYETRIDTK